MSYSNGFGQTLPMDNYATQFSQWQSQPKNQLRKFLLEEQHYKCAYCERQINNENSNIEHIIPKSVNVALSTLYHNLVMLCQGNEGMPGQREYGLHCDKSRGNIPIVPIVFYKSILPQFDANGNLLNSSRFLEARSDGHLVAKNEFNNEPVSGTLRLLNIAHHPKIVANRRGIIAGIQK